MWQRRGIPCGVDCCCSLGLGLGIPALLLGTASASVVARLSREKFRRWADYTFGATLVGVGLYLIWLA